jgi:hypothetical protein
MLQSPQCSLLVCRLKQVPEQSVVPPVHMHPPGFWQALPPVQLTAVCLQPVIVSQLSAVQTLLSSQSTAVR